VEIWGSTWVRNESRIDGVLCSAMENTMGAKSDVVIILMMGTGESEKIKGALSLENEREGTSR
jgi:hypothetical protein